MAGESDNRTFLNLSDIAGWHADEEVSRPSRGWKPRISWWATTDGHVVKQLSLVLVVPALDTMCGEGAVDAVFCGTVTCDNCRVALFRIDRLLGS